MSTNITGGVSSGGSSNDPTKLPLAGGVLTGLVYVSTDGLRSPLNQNFVIDAYNDTGAGTHNYFNFNPYGGGLELPSGSSGIKFGDATIQQTAGLLLTGGTVTGKVNINTGTGNVPLNIGITGTPTSYTVGDVWIAGSDMRFRDSAGTTKILISASNSNAFTNYQSITATNNSNPALKITQLGTGEALRVEDEASPDATAFVVNNAGRVGIGIEPDTTVALTIDGTGIKINGTTLIPAPSVTNPPATPIYSKELLFNINGVIYAIPLRVV